MILMSILLLTADPAPISAADAAALLERMKKLEDRVDALDAENAELRTAAAQPLVAHFTVPDNIRFRLSGYADVGFFKAGLGAGDGVSYVRDAGHATRPDLAGYPWVFLGDPWANAVNSQGESADLGLDRTNVARFDPIQSHGNPSFIVNTLNLDLLVSGGDALFFEGSLNFEPRQGTLGSPGDDFDVDLTYIEYKPFKHVDLHLFVGKFESTFGREYRERKAVDRYNITPSLISRYTVGTPTGVKVRGSFFDELLTYNVALTNGGMSTEAFGEFFNEIDKNAFKTVSGRLSSVKKIGPFAFDVGVSGVYGAQDNQPQNDIPQWQVGADLKIVFHDFTFEGEYLHAAAKGGGLGNAPVLRVDGWYLQGIYQFLPWFGVMARVDYRNATLYTPPNLYITNTGRLTATLRFDISFNLVVKLEYVRIQEITGPEIDDDVLTSSVVLKF